MQTFATEDLEQYITQLSVKTVVIASIILIVFTTLAALVNAGGKKHKHLKLPLFLILSGAIAIATVVLFVNTVYLNVRAESKGPVHWHSDIEFWACNAELELRDPTGFLSNKIGSATYHEHNDKRIHLEGVVVKKSEDAGIEKFMRVTGGYITHDSIGIPLNESGSVDINEWFASEAHDKLDGDPQHEKNFQIVTDSGSRITSSEKGPVIELKNGQTCANGQPAELQVFVYRTSEDKKYYTQSKLEDPTSYIMRDEATVPPGDCVIVEFDAPKDRTDKLCLQYGVRDSVRCTEFGVKEYTDELCNMKEVQTSEGPI